MEYNGVSKELSFTPKINSSDFSSFWSAGNAWGEITITKNEAKIEVVHGTLTLKKISFLQPGNSKLKSWKFKNGMIISEGEHGIFEF